MNFKKFLCVKNIFLWVAGLLTIFYGIYWLCYTWTVSATYLHDGEKIVETFKFAGGALAFSSPVAVKGEPFIEGQNVTFHGNILYFIGCMLFIVAGLAAIGLSFLMKKFKGKTFLFILVIIIAIAGLVLFWIGAVPAFNYFYSGSSSGDKAGPLDVTVIAPIESLRLKDGYSLVETPTRSPELYLTNEPQTWLLMFAIACTYMPGMIIPAPRAKAAPAAQPAEQPAQAEAPVEAPAEEPAKEE